MPERACAVNTQSDRGVWNALPPLIFRQAWGSRKQKQGRSERARGPPMDAMDPVRKVMGAVDGFQRRHGWVGVPYAVQKKFGDDNANLVGVALAWYGFTAIFPLLLVVVK